MNHSLQKNYKKIGDQKLEDYLKSTDLAQKDIRE